MSTLPLSALRPSSIARIAAALAILALLLIAQLSAAPAAHAATCKAPKYPGSGYFTSLSVTNTSCAAGSKFVVAYYKCRTKKGKSGRCVSKVSGYSCTEKRNAIPTEINGRVTCKKGNAKIVHSYQQNL